MDRQRIRWLDIEHAVDSLFSVWDGTQEARWARHSWAVLSRRGLTRYSDEPERHRCLVRFMTLAVLYREFCGLAWDEYNEPMLGWWADELEVSALRIGQLVGFATGSVDTGEFEAMESALAELVRAERPGVVQVLLDHWGDPSMLFASLWTTNYTPPEHLAPEAEDLYLDSSDLRWRWRPRIPQDVLLDVLGDVETGKRRAFA